MTINQKKEIQILVLQYIGQFESQAKAVAPLKNVSEATIIQIKNNRWESISDDMWRNVGKQIGWNTDGKELVETLAFTTLTLYFSIAKEEGEFFSIIGPSGVGKTFGVDWYVKNMKGKNVYSVQCAAYWNKKYFLQEMIMAMGKTFTGNVYEMMNFIVSELRKQDNPVFIFDEIDKLTDPVLIFFVTLYNRLYKLVGMVWVSTPTIENRINTYLHKRVGYAELKTRISAFIELPSLSIEETRLICHTRDIKDEVEIHKAYNESRNDIRRIDRIYIKEVIRKRRGNAA